jgi:hypothetical protein
MGEKKYMRWLGIVVLLCAVYGNAALDTLSGDLPKSISAENSPYIVTADIYVPSGKKITIEPGVVLLFKNFTGLHVQGILIALGTPDNPIIFTSENDQTFNPSSDLLPNPYDWNGLYIHEDGIGTELASFQLLYSVYGLMSMTKFIKVTDGVFNYNGRSDVTIEGEKKEVSETEPYSYSVSVKDAKVDGVPVKILYDPNARKRNVLRYSSLTVFVGGAALCGAFGYEWWYARKEVAEYSSLNVSNLIDNSNAKYEDAKMRRDRNLALTISGAVLAVAGTTGFIWTFYF